MIQYTEIHQSNPVYKQTQRQKPHDHPFCLPLDSVSLTGLPYLASIDEEAPGLVLLQFDMPKLVDIHGRPPLF